MPPWGWMWFPAGQKGLSDGGPPPPSLPPHAGAGLKHSTSAERGIWRAERTASFGLALGSPAWGGVCALAPSQPEVGSSGHSFRSKRSGAVDLGEAKAPVLGWGSA